MKRLLSCLMSCLLVTTVTGSDKDSRRIERKNKRTMELLEDAYKFTGNRALLQKNNPKVSRSIQGGEQKKSRTVTSIESRGLVDKNPTFNLPNARRLDTGMHQRRRVVRVENEGQQPIVSQKKIQAYESIQVMSINHPRDGLYLTLEEFIQTEYTTWSQQYKPVPQINREQPDQPSRVVFETIDFLQKNNPGISFAESLERALKFYNETKNN